MLLAQHALPQLLHKGGADVPEWFEAGRVYLDRNPNVNFGEARHNCAGREEAGRPAWNGGA